MGVGGDSSDVFRMHFPWIGRENRRESPWFDWQDSWDLTRRLKRYDRRVGHDAWRLTCLSNIHIISISFHIPYAPCIEYVKKNIHQLIHLQDWDFLWCRCTRFIPPPRSIWVSRLIWNVQTSYLFVYLLCQYKERPRKAPSFSMRRQETVRSLIFSSVAVHHWNSACCRVPAQERAKWWLGKLDEELNTSMLASSPPLQKVMSDTLLEQIKQTT